MIEYIRPVILDLIRCGERKKAWDLIDLYFENARTLEDFDVLGFCSLKADKRDTYLACAEATFALARSPEQIYRTRMNLYKAYNMMNYPEKALHYIEQNLQIDPTDFETRAQKAFNLSLMGNKKEAEDLLTELTMEDPRRKKKLEAAFAGKYLREGKLALGIRSFIETFKPKSDLFEGYYNMKRWDGKPLPGQKLYVEGEGGIGDEIINIRFFDHIREMSMEPILYSSGKYNRDVHEIFRRHGYSVLEESYSIDPRCPWIPLMSIPAYLDLKEEDLWRGPYLTPHKKIDLKSDWLKIGIKRSGNPYFGQDEYRKIPLNLMLSYLPKKAEIYYIDKERVDSNRVINTNTLISSWEDTLAIIDSMDVIVSSCTSLVHAAGAMGKTTFVAVPIAEYYIWTSSRRDNKSYWYGDNFYVMKQEKLRDWNAPLSKISKQLEEMFGEKYDIN